LGTSNGEETSTNRGQFLGQAGLVAAFAPLDAVKRVATAAGDRNARVDATLVDSHETVADALAGPFTTPNGQTCSSTWSLRRPTSCYGYWTGR
jgi:hypothetical protein